MTKRDLGHAVWITLLAAVGIAGLYLVAASFYPEPSHEEIGVVEIAPIPIEEHVPGYAPEPAPPVEAKPTPKKSAEPAPPFKSTLSPRLGHVVFGLSIPRMNKHWAVKEGVRDADIKKNPGHFPTTALPGEIGNVSIAAHRTRSQFWDIDRLRAGDEIIVEAAGARFTYRVFKREIVKPDAVRVVQPNPANPDRPAVRKLLTLVTCLKTGNHRREIVHAALVRQEQIT